MRNSCDEIRETVWDKDTGELTTEQATILDNHIKTCPSCAEHYKNVNVIKGRLKNPASIDIDSISSQAIEKATARADKVSHNKSFVFFGGGALAAAATILLIIGALWPEPTVAINLQEIITRHTICVAGGHKANMHCSSQTEFAETTMSELGFSPAPIDIKKFPFVQGGICQISKSFAAHAMFKSGDKVISYFQFADPGNLSIEESGIAKVNDGVYRYSIDDHEALIRKSSDGRYEFYVSELPFDKLRDFAEKNREETGK